MRKDTDVTWLEEGYSEHDMSYSPTTGLLPAVPCHQAFSAPLTASSLEIKSTSSK